MLDQRIKLQHEASLVETKIASGLGNIFKGFSMKNVLANSAKKKPVVKTDHELKTAKFMNYMTEMMTENRNKDYKSKIVESSMQMDPLRKQVLVDADAVHRQIEKQCRKRYMQNIKPEEVSSYVFTQVKRQKDREIRIQAKKVSN